MHAHLHKDRHFDILNNKVTSVVALVLSPLEFGGQCECLVWNRDF